MKSLASRAIALVVAMAMQWGGTLIAAEVSASNGLDLSGFPQWRSRMAEQARQQGVTSATIDRYLLTSQPLPKVIAFDQKQPEFSQTYWTYSANALGGERVKNGKRLAVKHQNLLRRLEQKTGISATVLLAFWGMETGYGSVLGDFSTLSALATLAYEGRREAFFSHELIAALKLIDTHRIVATDLQGSWAGAFGQMQFMPSTALAYATSARGQGPAALRGSAPDALVSASAYLQDIGWRRGQLWGRQVRLPLDLNLAGSGFATPQPIATWAAQGVRRFDGKALDHADTLASQEGGAALLLPAGINGPAFLIYDNFRVIMRWNRSILYALAVGQLSDLLAARPPVVATRPADDRALSRAEIVEIQTRLTALGFLSGPSDGLAGAGTQAAAQHFQQSQHVPADGYVDMHLLALLRQIP